MFPKPFGQSLLRCFSLKKFALCGLPSSYRSCQLGGITRMAGGKIVWRDSVSGKKETCSETAIRQPLLKRFDFDNRFYEID